MIRAVLDTNVLISGTLWNGPPSQILKTTNKFQLLLSEDILKEFERVLLYPKLARYISRTGKIIPDLSNEIWNAAEHVTPTSIPDNVVRDENDRIILAAALGGHADYLVSGDDDLLDVGVSYMNVKIVNPSTFLVLLAQVT